MEQANIKFNEIIETVELNKGETKTVNYTVKAPTQEG